jgi:UDP-glucose 4-epimerase
MKVLVTGGAGFIGSHVTDGLVRQGHQIIVLDNLSSGRESNLRYALSTGQAEFIRGDVRNRKLLGRILPGVDRIFHLAATVGVHNIVRRPLKGLMNNLQGASSVLEAATEAGGIKVILFSSSEVYGKGRKGKLYEDSDSVLGATTVSRWSYAASKVMDEFLALNYAGDKNLPVVVVRCFNTSGPRQVVNSGMVLPRLILQALKGEPMTVYGDGKQTRCFSYVGDVVRGVLLLADAPAAQGEVFNIGNDEETTILDLARRIKELTGSSSKIRLTPYAEVFGAGFEDIRHRVPSLEKIQRITGYRPQVDLQELLVLAVRDVAGSHDLDVPEAVAGSAVKSGRSDVSRAEPGLVPTIPA